jgi:phosphoribosylaminoimidazole (AIR) synthetase
MYRTFNMGVGMVVICAETDAATIQSHFECDRRALLSDRTNRFW